MYDGNELISSTLVEREAESENILRPQTLEGYIGQDKVKENLMVYISAARRRNENLDHVLLYGPPGLKNYFGSHNSQRNAHKDNRNQRTCHRKSRRPCRAAFQAD